MREVKEKEVGKVSTYFSHVSVAAIKLSDKLKIGDKVHIKGNTTDLKEDVNSIQKEGQVIKEGKKGDHVGIKVSDKVRPNDIVFIAK